MTLPVLKNYIYENCAAPGTGNVTTGSAVTGFLPWSTYANGSTVYYILTDDASHQEWGFATTASGSFTRTTVLGNSSGTTAKLNFTSSVRAYSSIPAERAVLRDTAGDLRGAHAAVLTGALPTVATGEGQIGGSSTHGLLLSGQGATNDLRILNSAGSEVAIVPTGSKSFQLTNNDNKTVPTLKLNGGGSGTWTTGVHGMLAVANATNYTGAISSGQNAYLNSVRITGDQLDASVASSGSAIGFLLGHTFGGSAVKGSRNAMNISLTQSATTGNVNSKFYTALNVVSEASANDGGTFGDERGFFFAANFYATVDAGATYIDGAIGVEIDLDVREATHPPRVKIGMQIVQLTTDVGAGTASDFAFVIGNQTYVAQPGWAGGIVFGGNSWPMNATSTMILAKAPNTGGGPSVAADTGIDFSIVSFGTAFIKGPNDFMIDPSGYIKIAGNQVLGPRITGYGSFTNGAKTGFDATTATTGAVAAAVAQLITDLKTHGMIGT